MFGFPAGTQTLSVDLATENPAEEHIFVFGSRYDKGYIDRIERRGFRVVICPFVRREISIIDDLRSILWLREFCIEERINIVHSHSSKSNLICRFLKLCCKVRNINHIHGVPFTVSKSRFGNFFIFLVEVFSTFLVDEIVVVNRLYKTYFPYRHAKVLYNFKANKNISIFKKPQGKKSILHVGFVGRFDRQKDPQRFVEIARLLHGKGFRFSMWGNSVTGESSFQAPDCVSVFDWVDPSYEGEIDIDVLLVVSKWEAFSLVTLEAAQRGIVPVGVPVDGLAEVIRSIGVPIEFPSNRNIVGILLWLKGLSDEDFSILGKSVMIRSSILNIADEIQVNNFYYCRGGDV